MSSNIGYGFKFENNNENNELLNKIENGEVEIGEDFNFIYQGYCDAIDFHLYVCINKSIIRSNDCGNAVEIFSLNKENGWDEKLLSLANDVLNIKNPKIGWYLCATS